MTSIYAAFTAISRMPVHASAAVRALAIAAAMQGIVVLSPRSPGPGRP